MNKQINLFWIALVLSAIIFTSCPPPVPEVVSVTEVSLSQSELILNVNEFVTLTATVSPENASNKNVSWFSSDKTVATVDTNGLVKALKAGTATITVKTEDGEKTATCSVTVAPVVVNVTEVSLSQSELTLNVNESVALNATVSPENATNKNVSWFSSDKTVATVDTNGLVKALKAGTTTITVKTEDSEKIATCNVTVTSMVKLDLKGKSFQMGGKTIHNAATPVHKVTFTRDIYMCDHEVTQKEWQAVMGNNPSYFKGEEADKKVAYGEVQENRPVEQVSWYDAIAYCNKLSIIDGLEPCYVSNAEINWKDLKYAEIPTEKNAAWNAVVCDFSKNGYRLPTEAEWEYAARGGLTGDVYAGTDDVTKLDDYAWYKDNSNSRTHEVKKRAPNGYGLYDMSGNVLEWCWDWYGKYANGDAIAPTGASSGTDRVGRGGRWDFSDFYCSAFFRGEPGDLVNLYEYRPSSRKNYFGFRLARSVQ